MSRPDQPVLASASSLPGSTTRASCPHGLRPGTTVCLHCLHDKRAATRARRFRLAARVGLGGVVAGLATALVVGAVSSLRGSSSGSEAESGEAVEQPAPATAAAQRSRTVVPAGAPRAVATTAAVATALTPRVAIGRTSLGEGMYVERSTDSVIVHFDTEELRTRFDWKFEGVVRATLPSVFPQARAALDSIPPATLAHGDLLNDLTRRGVRINLGASGALTVWPLTRPGEDGPLVVAYRVTATR